MHADNGEAEGLPIEQAELAVEVFRMLSDTLIHRVPRLDDGTVHVNPAALPGVDYHAATAHHRPAVAGYPLLLIAPNRAGVLNTKKAHHDPGDLR